MNDIDLKYKPLVEVYIEIRWALKTDKGRQFDPHYKFLLGHLFDRIKSKYPKYESLPAASVPDEMVGHVVQHRFRSKPNDWPLVQLGPGIFAFNETSKYIWSSFRESALAAVNDFFQAYPAPEDLKIESVFLKYIDALPFDSASQDLLNYLQDKLKINIALPSDLFKETGVSRQPATFNWQISFPYEVLHGRVFLGLATGQQRKEGGSQPALIWETRVHSTGDDVPDMPDGFENWLETAHDLTHDWFFKLIKGDLEKEFRGE